MNDFEVFLQDKINTLKKRREEENKRSVSEKELIKLILMEITYGELFIILRDFPNVDINPILEKCIYIEVRSKGFLPEDALNETKKQMENRL